MGNEAKSWRDNWFIINWLGALPLIRSIKEPTATAACTTFTGDFLMLSGGAVGMWWKMQGSMGKSNALQTTGDMVWVMYAGMAAGNLIFNTMKGAPCSKRPSEERQPLVLSV